MFKSWPCDRIMPGYDQGIGATGYLAKLFDGADSFHGRSREAGKRFLFPMFHRVRGIDGQQDCTSFRQYYTTRSFLAVIRQDSARRSWTKFRRANAPWL
jgi:hypothetical protein